MKKLLTLFIFIPIIGFAQDSTSYSTQEVKEFEPLSIMDEFEKVYGAEQKTALRVGVMNFNTSENYGNGNVFIDFERKITSNTSLKVGMVVYKSPYYNFTEKNFFPLFFDFKYYLKQKNRIKIGLQKNNFSGNYVGTRFVLNDPFQLKYKQNSNFLIESTDKNKFFATKQLDVFYGYQFGSKFDFRIVAGITNRFEIDKITNTSPFENLTLNLKSYPNFFLKTQSSVGFDLIKNKSAINECDILNCNKERNHVFKFNLMDIFYFDSHNATINFSSGFEQRLSNSYFTLTSSLNASYFSKKYQFSLYSSATENVPFTSLKEVGLASHFGIRYYSAKKKNIMKGIDSKNLNGFYHEIGTNLGYSYFNLKNTLSPFSLRPYVAIGSQKIYSEKYYIDLSLRVSYNNKNDSYIISNPVSSYMRPIDVSFGINAGLIK